MAGNTPPTARQIIGMLSTVLRPDFRDIWMIVVYSVAVGLLSLGIPIGSQMIFNFVAFAALLQPLVVLGIILLFVLSVAGALRAVISFMVEILQRRLFVRIVGDLGERLPKVRKEAFDRANGPDLVNRFFDVLTIQKVGSTLVLDGIAAVLQTLIGLIIVAFYHPFLLGFSLVLFAVVLLVVFVLGRGAVRTSIAESTAKYATAATLESIVTEPRLFKQADRAGLATRLVNERIEDYLTARRAHFRVYFRQVVAALLVQVLAMTSLMILGGYLVIKEQLSLGQLVASELIITIALAALTKFAIKFDDIYDMYAGIYKVDALLGLPRERADGEDRDDLEGAASLLVNELAFAYPDGPVVFSGLNLRVAPGERVAMVSFQADGKTTLADLLFGSRSPDAGHIEIDGLDSRDYSLASLRHRVSVADRDESIQGTIEHNVTLGRAESTPECCRDALQRVGLLDEIRELPNGMQTELTPTGSPLSDGQRCRLVIARAIAGKPGLLVIDGLLDGLDADTRRRVLEGLTDPSWDCTVLFLSSCDWYAGTNTRVVSFVEAVRPGGGQGDGKGQA